MIYITEITYPEYKYNIYKVYIATSKVLNKFNGLCHPDESSKVQRRCFPLNIVIILFCT